MATQQRTRAYWYCQLVGWSVYGLVILVMYSFMGTPVLRMAAHSVVYCSAGIGLTHLLRLRIRTRSWATLRVVALAWRMTLSSAVLAVVLTAVVHGSTWFWFHMGRGEHPWISIAFLAFNFWFLFVCWQLIYFVVHALERARNAELLRWRLTAAAQDAELRFLRAQMHPHFLFNCLNGLRGLITEDPSRAETMVNQLASMFRYSLSAETSPTVPLERELEVVRDYLALEEVRLEERLSVKLDIAPESLTAPVPAMLVQTLVENAIKHGVAKLPQGGEVTVSARVIGQMLEVQVGSPLSSPSTAALGEGGGVGLANARERLRLLFGDQASLSLTRAAGDRASARVTIPLSPPQAA